MKRNSHLALATAGSLAALVAVTGCGPMWYGPPPPTGPVGGNPPTLVQPNPAAPQGSGPTWSPTPGASGARDLGAVPSVPAEKVLEVPGSEGASSSTWHEVRQGETLTGIAGKYGVSVQSLRDANYFEESTQISTGDLLLIPKSK